MGPLAAPRPAAHSTSTISEDFMAKRDDDDEKSKQAVYGVDVDISVVLG